MIDYKLASIVIDRIIQLHMFPNNQSLIKVFEEMKSFETMRRWNSLINRELKVTNRYLKDIDLKKYYDIYLLMKQNPEDLIYKLWWFVESDFVCKNIINFYTFSGLECEFFKNIPTIFELCCIYDYKIIIDGISKHNADNFCLKIFNEILCDSIINNNTGISLIIYRLFKQRLFDHGNIYQIINLSEFSGYKGWDGNPFKAINLKKGYKCLLLSEKLKKLNCTNNTGQTILHILAERLQGSEMFEFAIKKYNVDLQDFNGKTPLHYAARLQRGKTSYFKNAKMLIEKSAKVNQGIAKVNIQDIDGHTPLHIAAINNNWNVVELLLENNADKTIKNLEGKTACDLAVEFKSHRSIEVFTGEKKQQDFEKKQLQREKNRERRLNNKKIEILKKRKNEQF